MNLLNSLSLLLPQFYIPSIRLTDCLEIIIIICLIYKMIDSLKNTRAMIILKGIAILLLFYAISYIFNFSAILILFHTLVTLAVFAIIVVFQQELRKTLENLGTKKVPFTQKLRTLFKKKEEFKKRYSDATISELTDACFELSQTKTGALIVIEKDLPLKEFADTGIYLNSDITKQLLINIFEKNTPLHDGAVIISGDTLVCATAYLPLSDDKSINKHMGTRHRAAIGLSEVTDCQVLVVSEENGNVSYVKEHTIRYNISKDTLTNLLKKEQMLKNHQEKENIFKKLKHNFGLKTLSVLLGCLLWLFLMNTANPIISKTITNVPITVENEEAITSTGKIYEIVSDREVSVIVSGKRSDIDKIEKEDIIVTADLSKMSYVYAVPLSAYSLTYDDIQCSVVNNEIMTIQISDKIDKEFPIEVNTIGTNDSYYIGDFTLSETNIIVSGSKELTNIIGSVKLNFSITDISENGIILLTPTIYDKNGYVLADSQLTVNLPEIEVAYKVYPKKLVPINITSNSNVPIKEITQDVYSVYVAGEQFALNKLEHIDVLLDLQDLANNQSSELSKTIDITDYLPQNIYFADTNKDLTITLIFDEDYSRELNMSKNNISLRNLQNGLTVSFESNINSIRISGEKELIDAINISDLNPYIDLTGLSVGEYNLILQYANIDGVKILDNPLIKIRITE